jgi:dTDP-4-amino-4,6-dideoxygalactose transaminase
MGMMIDGVELTRIKIIPVDGGKLRDALKLQGIETGVHYQPNHSLSFFKRANQAAFSVLEKVFPTLLTLPMYPDLELTDVDFVINTLDELLRQII